MSHHLMKWRRLERLLVGGRKNSWHNGVYHGRLQKVGVKDYVGNGSNCKNRMITIIFPLIRSPFFLLILFIKSDKIYIINSLNTESTH